MLSRKREQVPALRAAMPGLVLSMGQLALASGRHCPISDVNTLLEQKQKKMLKRSHTPLPPTLSDENSRTGLDPLPLSSEAYLSWRHVYSQSNIKLKCHCVDTNLPIGDDDSPPRTPCFFGLPLVPKYLEKLLGRRCICSEGYCRSDIRSRGNVGCWVHSMAHFEYRQKQSALQHLQGIGPHGL